MSLRIQRARAFANAIAVACTLGGASRRVCAQAPTTTSDSANRQVAIVIFAEATAREVRFARQPQLHVKLTGALDSVHVLERRNLPSPVVAGTTYRDVYVAVELFGRVNAECIANTLTEARTGGARVDCASLELRGTTRRPPTAAATHQGVDRCTTDSPPPCSP